MLRNIQFVSTFEPTSIWYDKIFYNYNKYFHLRKIKLQTSTE